MSEVVEVEQVVIGSDGAVYRSPAAKRRLAWQKSEKHETWARLGIAKVEPKSPVDTTSTPAQNQE